MQSVLADTPLAPVVAQCGAALFEGKMLRARLLLALAPAAACPPHLPLPAAAATELLHSASLLHDDVIDGGRLRRGAPAFWVAQGIPGAVLLGDLLVVQAVRLVAGLEAGAVVAALVRFAGDMCAAEARQELCLRAAPGVWADAVAIARAKTGALFAFAAHVAGWRDPDLQAALTASGYDLGTAYQLADDLLDACGQAADTDKSLAQDQRRHKTTAASTWQAADEHPLDHIRDLLRCAAIRLDPWPPVARAWNDYVDRDVMPVLNQHTSRFAAAQRGRPSGPTDQVPP